MVASWRSQRGGRIYDRNRAPALEIGEGPLALVMLGFMRALPGRPWAERERALTREEMAGDRERRILETTAGLVAGHGYLGFRVAELTRRAGVGLGTVRKRGMAGAAAAKGYPALTVGDVISRARVSRRVFYELFEDKEACFLAAWKVVATHIGQLAGSAAESEEGDPPRQIVAAFAAVLDFFRLPHEAGEELTHGSRDGRRQLHDRVSSRGPFSSLEQANLGAVQPGAVAELFLGEAGALAAAGKIASELGGNLG